MPTNLFPGLHRRMVNERQAGLQFIGEFDGAAALPPSSECPACSFWLDSSTGGIRLLFNTTLLREWCSDAAQEGADVTKAEDIQEDIQEAISSLEELVTPAFYRMLETLSNADH